jgi:hypothetical protein
MKTPRATESRPPWWRVLLLLGCSELLLLTREGFGKGYFFLLWAMFLLRATFLIPFPTVASYAHFQALVGIILVFHLIERQRTAWKGILASLDLYNPGKPGRVLFLLQRRSVFLLFFLEPGLAAFAAWFMYDLSSLTYPWTPPFFGVFWWSNPDAPSVFELPHVLQAYLSYGHEILAEINPRLIAELLLLTFPLCTLLNNIAEYRAEHAKAPAPSMPPGNAPVLTFPEVR